MVSPSKLGRMLEPSGLGVEIDEPIDPPIIMLKVQELAGFGDRKAYGKWHMGIGGAIVTPDPDSVLNATKEYGLTAKEIGIITQKPGIRIRNRGASNDSKWLDF